MPRGDGTGPTGMGSMTGRAAGYCAGFRIPGFRNLVDGRLGRRYSRSRFGHWWHRWGPNPDYDYESPHLYGEVPSVTAEQELDFLQNQSIMINDRLSEIQARITELEKKEGKKKS